MIENIVTTNIYIVYNMIIVDIITLFMLLSL